jgi:prepilin-type N-terminal cleavage/methylation domain-containing protein
MKTLNSNTRKFRKGFTLIEMLGVLAIIAILISVIAVGVLSAINRSRIVATVANFKNIETAVVGFVALPNAGGTVPLTEISAANATPIEEYQGAGVVSKVAQDGSYTLDQVLRASGLIDRPVTWRVGADGSARVAASTERVFMISRNAWAKAALSVNGAAAPAGNAVWSDYNASFVAEATTGLAVGTPAAFPVVANTTNPSGVDTINFFLDGTSPVQGSRIAFVRLHNVSLKDAQKLSQELNGSLDDSEETPTTQFRGRLIYNFGTLQQGDVFFYLASF